MRTTMQLPFDPDDPPVEPPRACHDPLLWHVSHALFMAHRPRRDNWCDCRERSPCPARRLAVRGLMRACLPRRDHGWGILPRPG